jgi:hypothetical protein
MLANPFPNTNILTPNMTPAATVNQATLSLNLYTQLIETIKKQQQQQQFLISQVSASQQQPQFDFLNNRNPFESLYAAATIAAFAAATHQQQQSQQAPVIPSNDLLARLNTEILLRQQLKQHEQK